MGVGAVVAVGGIGVSVGGNVVVGGMGVSVGAVVAVGGIGVSVGAVVAVGGMGVSVGGNVAVGVAVGNWVTVGEGAVDVEVALNSVFFMFDATNCASLDWLSWKFLLK